MIFIRYSANYRETERQIKSVWLQNRPLLLRVLLVKLNVHPSAIILIGRAAEQLVWPMLQIDSLRYAFALR